jgi:diguanylate cyclase (GGDEF)-like protein
MMTALLVDDDTDVRALLARALEANGFSVFESSTLAEAEHVFATAHVDVAVVSSVLPDGASLDFIEKLRARDRAVSVVFVSGHFQDLQTLSRLSSELDVALVAYRPIDAASLARKISRLTSTRDAPNSDRTARTSAAPAGSTTHTSDSGPLPSEVAAEMAELRKQFTERLPDKLDDLDRAIHAARLGAASIESARQLAHRLRGSAGSYGHAAVSQSLGLVEDLLGEAVGDVPSRDFFWKELERAMGDTRLAAVAAPELLPDWLERAGPGNKTLLVVDDDPELLQLAVAMGRKLFIDVVTAQTPDEALQRAEAHPLIGAILDVHLHGDLSFSLARKIRETRHNSEIPLAFMSVDGRMNTRVAATEAGATRYLEKPVSDDTFRELAQHFIRLAHAQQGRVLIVEDDADVATHYTLHLRAAGYVVDCVASADTLVDKLEALRPDVLLLDVDLPRISGLDVCRALRMSPRWEFLPILVVTGHADAETRLRAFRAGASDVIVKPVLPEELFARVSVQEERTRLLRERADKDPLSGLMSRRAFTEAFQRALGSCDREERPLSVALLDIDKFKGVNDTHGHLVGDQVIARFGELLRRRFRVEDLRGRWGGEEFVLVFVGADTEFAAHTVERLLAEFRALRFTGEADEPFSVTFTAGIATFPRDGTSMTALVRRADERLYQGKRDGRNRVVYASPSAAPSAREPLREPLRDAPRDRVLEAPFTRESGAPA